MEVCTERPPGAFAQFRFVEMSTLLVLLLELVVVGFAEKF